MKKRGFTLAEVLITLGIIGVVAALTAPSLVMSSRNESNAAKLAVTVSNLENAFTNAIVQEDVDNIYKTRMWSSSDLGSYSDDASIAPFIGNLSKYIHLNGYEITKAKDFYNGTGPYTMTATGGKGDISDTDKKGTTDMDKCFIVYTKNGAALFMKTYATGDSNTTTQDAVAEKGGALYSDAMDLFIDVNGKAAPNTYGRDIFHFYVGSDGILYPYGGLDVSIYEKGDNQSLWNNTKNKSNSACLDENINGGLGCTARVIAEGYKINY